MVKDAQRTYSIEIFFPPTIGMGNYDVYLFVCLSLLQSTRQDAQWCVFLGKGQYSYPAENDTCKKVMPTNTNFPLQFVY